MKALGFGALFSLVIGNIIGSGIFMLPSSLAQLGGLSFIGWGISTVGAILIGLIFASLSRMIPDGGGPYAFCKKGLGPFWGFLVAWFYWLSMWIGSVATLIAIMGYASALWPHYIEAHSILIGLSIIWALTLINLRSLRFSGIIQVLLTCIKLLPLVLILAFCFPHISSSHYTQLIHLESPTVLQTIFYSISLTFWSFLGVESATIPQNHVTSQKYVTYATIGGVITVALIYIAVCVAIFGLIPTEALKHSSAPFALAIEYIFGRNGTFPVAIAAILASLGALNGWTLIQSQVPVAATKDGLFPKIFGAHSKNMVPYASLLLTATCMSAVYIAYSSSALIIQHFTELIVLATLFSLLTYGLCITVFLKRTKTLRGRVQAIIAFLIILCAVASIPFSSLLIAFITLAIGSIFYYILRQ